MAARQLAHAFDVFHRGAKSQEVLHELLAGLLIGLEPGLDRGAADHAEARVRAHEVEVVHVVAVAVHVGVGLDPVAQLEPEIDAPLAVSVHRSQSDLHHRLGDGSRVAVARAVYDLELHAPRPMNGKGRCRRRGLSCCCCCGMPCPSSPVTLAGTLLGWKYVSRSAISRSRRIARQSWSNSRGRSAID